MKRRFTAYPSNYIGAASETSGAAMRRKKKALAKEAEEGTQLLATDGDWELYDVKNYAAALKLSTMYGGGKAKWSIAYSGDSFYFDHMIKRGPIYVFVNKSSGEKYASQPATNQWFYDADDRGYGKQAFIDFIDEHPAFAEFFDVDDDVEACGDINASTDIYASFFANDAIPRATDGEWEMWTPATWEGAQEIASIGGNKANWAFAYSGNDHYWRAYSDRGPIYIFVNTATGEKYASHPATKSWFYDEADREQGLKVLTKFLDDHPKFIVDDFEDLLRESARNGWEGTWLDRNA